jgi:hypothetical protein
MANGSLDRAQLLFAQAQDLLYGKMVNPLAAAAGGYVLLAVERGPEVERWHDWVPNLANWYSWLPDGMIQPGRLALRRRDPAALDDARAAFFQAHRRGLPFFTLGLQWMVDGLSLLAAANVRGARPRLKEVQQVAWRANLQQPFTTLRLVGR